MIQKYLSHTNRVNSNVCYGFESHLYLRSQRSEHCVKRADPDVKRLPRYLFLKLHAAEPMWGIGENSNCIKLLRRRTILFSTLRAKNRVLPSQFYALGIFPCPPQWFRSLQLQQSISRKPLDIWIYPFHTGFRTPRSLDTNDFQIDSKHLN